MKAITEDETSIVDESDRIYWLVEHCLEKVATSSEGWDMLLRDPTDKRYWERTYPLSYMHGGGPPALHVIASQAAREKYKLDV